MGTYYVLRLLTTAISVHVYCPTTYDVNSFTSKTSFSLTCTFFISGKFIKCKFVAPTDSTPHLLLHSFHLSSEIALYSPPSLVLGHFSECYIGIIFSCLNFVVFLKFKFYDKKFSSWLLASHRIIILVWMLNIFLIHFFLILGNFLPFVDYCRFPFSAESARFPRVLLAEAMFLAASS